MPPLPLPGETAPVRPVAGGLSVGNLAEVRPLHAVDVGRHGGLVDAAFSADGSELFALLRADAVNVWGVALEFWPEALGVLSAAWVLVFVVLIVRVLRRVPRGDGLHCRRCDYSLAGLPGRIAECPECGVAFAERGPVRGGRRDRRLVRAGRRIAPLAAAMALLPVVCLAARTLALPRSGSLSTLIVLPSRSFGRWIEEHDPGDRFQEHSLQRASIVAIEASTGAITRTVWEGPDAAFRFCSESGGCFRLEADRTLARIDLATGRVRSIGRVTWSGFSRATTGRLRAGDRDDLRLLGPSPGGGEYFVVAEDAAAGLTILEVDLATGRTRARFSTRLNRPETYPRRRWADASIVPGEPVRFLVAHHEAHVRGGVNHRIDLRLHDGAGAILHAFDPLEDPVRALAMSRDGRQVYVGARQELGCIDLASGACTSIAHEDLGIGGMNAVLPDGTVLGFAGFRETEGLVVLRAAANGGLGPAARLSGSPGTRGGGAVISSDGSTIAVWARRVIGGDAPLLLVIYKLPASRP